MNARHRIGDFVRFKGMLGSVPMPQQDGVVQPAMRSRQREQRLQTEPVFPGIRYLLPNLRQYAAEASRRLSIDLAVPNSSTT